MDITGKHPQSTYDCIVIGSGLGGLSAAAYLAKHGKSVIVLEQSSLYGGYGQSLSASGFVFDFALHCIDGWGLIDGVLKDLDEELENGVVPCMRTTHIVLPDGDYWASSIEDITATLTNKFPEETENIKKYYDDLVDFMSLQLQFQRTGSMSIAVKIASKYSFLLSSSLENVINHYFNSERLKSYVFASHSTYLFDYSWHFSAYYFFHSKYTNSGVSVKGGSRHLISAFTHAIVKFGGDIMRRALVNKIVVKDGRASGVVLVDGTEIKANEAVISNGDSMLTLSKMMNLEDLPSSLQNEYKRWESYGPSLSYYVTNLGLDIDIKKEYGLKHDLTIYYPSNDVLRIHKDINRAELPDDFWLWILCPSVNDETLAPKGCSTLILAVQVPFQIENETACSKSYFDGFKVTGEKGEEYFAKKKEIADKMVKRAEKIFPGLGKHIIVEKKWTPQDFRDFTLNQNGSSLGYRMPPPSRKNRNYQGRLGIPIDTGMPGLYMVGLWSELGVSAGSAVQSGRFAAYDILGMKRPPIVVSTTLKNSPDDVEEVK